MVRAGERTREAPQRTCIACRQVKPKHELVRIVRTPEGTLEVDPRGKKPGRGAYLCRVYDCWEAGLKPRRLEHALKASFGQQQIDTIREFARAMPHRDAGVVQGVEKA